MRFKNIEVSGIMKVVFNRTKLWNLDQYTGKWHSGCGDTLTIRTHGEVMDIIERLKKNRKYRMWVHGDTLNIVRRHEVVQTGQGPVR